MARQRVTQNLPGGETPLTARILACDHCCGVNCRKVDKIAEVAGETDKERSSPRWLKAASACQIGLDLPVKICRRLYTKEALGLSYRYFRITQWLISAAFCVLARCLLLTQANAAGSMQK